MKDLIDFIKLPLLIIAVYSGIFDLVNRYDWGHPIIKFLCSIALFSMVLLVTGRKGTSAGKPAFVRIEIGLCASLILIVLCTWGVKYSRNIADPPQCDIGYTTHHAVQQLVLNRTDPYASNPFNKLGDDPKYWGYRYGPGMALFYLPSAWFPGSALKIITLIYTVAAFGVLSLLLYDRRSTGEEWIASTLFSILLILLPERTWSEILVQGSTDILPALLLLASTLLIRRNDRLAAGICAGLAFSSKFAPALFFILLFVRRKTDLRFFSGVAIGTLPLLAFLAWSGGNLLNNVFFVNAVKEFDSTSLYSITPASLHFVFPLIQISAVAFFVARNFNWEMEFTSLAIDYTLLIMIIEATYREVHVNHLYWFLPFLSLIFAWQRHAGIPLPAPPPPPGRKGRPGRISRQT
jgi:hypothetical protein